LKPDKKSRVFWSFLWFIAMQCQMGTDNAVGRFTTAATYCVSGRYVAPPQAGGRAT